MFARLLQAYVLLNVIAFFLIVFKAISNVACTISINDDLTDKHPLLIQTTRGKLRFVLPTASDNITLHNSDKMELFCPGSFILIDDKSLKVDLTTITCHKNQFKLKTKVVKFPSISCSKSPKDVARYTGKHCIRDEYKEFQIGYEYKKKFLNLITGCFDKKKLNTLYTVHTLSKMINWNKYGHPRKSSWTEGSFYGNVSVDDAYKRINQRIAINNQLGLNSDSRKYIANEDSKYYLLRGYLAPKEDFMYGPQQDATYYFLNVVPQWALLNIRNWKLLEASLRELASTREINLKIYTGTSEIFSLPHDNEKQSVELYLNTQKEKKTIPIPKFLWKVAYDESSGKGVAFVGVNNPFIKENFDEYTICKNICDKLNYIQINLNYTMSGYIYCCEVSDLVGKVSTIPIKNTTKLLI